MTLHTKRREARLRTVKCIICDTLFETTHSQGKYCSDICRRIGHRKSWNKYRYKNKISRNEWGRKHYENTKKHRLKQMKEYNETPGGKETTRKSGLNQRTHNPEKYTARMEVLKAKQKGTIVPEPCAICGISPSEAHHTDHSKPLDIIWLYNLHHREVHKSGDVAIHIEEGRVVE